MKKRTLCLALALVMLLGIVMIPATYAEDEQMQIQRLETELKDIKNKQATTKGELDKLKAAQSSENSLLAKQTDEINLIKDNIETTQELLNIYTNQIAAKEAEIERLDGELDKAVEIFKNRLVYYHENNTDPDSMWMDVIFDSQDLPDLLSRIETSRELMSYDKKLIQKINDNLDEQKKQKEEIQQASDNYTVYFEDLLSQEEDLAAKINQSEATIAAFQADIDARQKELDEENAEMAETEKEMNRLLEAKRKREEEERKKREEQAKNNGAITGGTPIATNSDAGFIWPLPRKYIITSWWGYRADPFTGRQAYHNGLDIATSGTSPEIYAIGDGEVITAGGNAYSGYGYYVIIDHNNGYQSLYGHMNQWPSVSVGQNVKQGQVIGYVGTTGRSTGKHLHFTIYKNGKDVNPIDYVPVP